MEKTILVTEHDGVFKVNAEFESGFVLVPSPEGKLQLAFWDENRLEDYLRDYGYSPLITHN